MENKIDIDAVYRASDEVVAREIEGELIIVPLTSGIGDMEDELFTLNETGRAIWNKLDGSRSLKVVALELQEDYDAPADEIEKDVTGLAQELLKRLSTTVDLLYHPEIVLMGTETYSDLQRHDGLEFPLHNAYQGSYRFKDERVQFLAEILSPVCRYLLELMNESESPLYWKKDSGTVEHSAQQSLEIVNQWLIAFFDDMLSRVELQKVSPSLNSKDKFIFDARSSIDTLIR